MASRMAPAIKRVPAMVPMVLVDNLTQDKFLIFELFEYRIQVIKKLLHMIYLMQLLCWYHYYVNNVSKLFKQLPKTAPEVAPENDPYFKNLKYIW